MRGHRDTRYDRVWHGDRGDDGVSTLLPLRAGGPPTDVSGALAALWSHQGPQQLFVPNLPSVVDQMRPSVYEVPVNHEPKQLPERRVSYGNDRPSAPQERQQQQQRRALGSGGATVAAGPTTPPGTVRSPQRRRRAPQGEPPSRSPTGRRSRGIHQENKGEVTPTERVRFRNEVSRKLMDLYDEAVELDECSGNMVAQLTDAMRADPRRAREVFGLVRLTPRPTEEQQAALDGVTDALAALRESLVELVAAYLTPEEKRHLGVDTNLFQTRAQRATTYQYGPPSKKDKASTQARPCDREMVDSSTMTTATYPANGDADVADAERGGSASTAGGGGRTADTTATTIIAAADTNASPVASRRGGASTRGSQENSSLQQPPQSGLTHVADGGVAAPPPPPPPPQSPPFTPERVSYPFGQEPDTVYQRTPTGTVVHRDPQPTYTNGGGGGEGEADANANHPQEAQGPRSADGADEADGVAGEDDPAPAARTDYAVSLPLPTRMLHHDSDSDSESAVGTPERQRAPGDNASLSSLGGGDGAAYGSTSGPSPTRPAPALAPAAKASAAPPGRSPLPPFAMGGAQGPKGAPTKLLIKKVPISAMAKKLPFPMPMRKTPVPQQHMPFIPPPPAHAPSHKAAGSGTATPSAPLSSVRPAQAPALPAGRAEFRRFMIDTDSESLA